MRQPADCHDSPRAAQDFRHWPLAAFILARKNEIAMVRVIISAKVNELDTALLKKGCVKCMYKIAVLGERDKHLRFCQRRAGHIPCGLMWPRAPRQLKTL